MQEPQRASQPLPHTNTYHISSLYNRQCGGNETIDPLFATVAVVPSQLHTSYSWHGQLLMDHVGGPHEGM